MLRNIIVFFSYKRKNIKRRDKLIGSFLQSFKEKFIKQIGCDFLSRCIKICIFDLNRTIGFILILIFCLIFLALISSFHLRMPFYVSHDMDLITLIDIISINSSQLPIHLIHPGAGMFLIFHWMERVFDFFLISPILSYANLQNSLEPILVVANKIHFLRWVNHIFLISIAMLLFYVLYKIHKGLLFIFSGGLLCLNIQSFWFWHPDLVRTEIFSVFFLLVALTIILHTFKKKNFTAFSLILIFLSFSYITKTQSLFIVSAIFFFMIFYYPKGILPRWFFLSSTYHWALFLFLIFSVIGLLIDIEAITASYISYLNHISIPFLLSFILHFRKNKNHKFLNYIQDNLSPYFMALFISFFLAILISSTIVEGTNGFITQLATYFKLIFMSFYEKFLIKDYAEKTNGFLSTLNGYKLYLVCLFLVGFPNFYYLYKYRNLKNIIFYGIVIILLILNITIISRGFQDRIWNQLFFTILILASLRVFLTSPFHKLLKLVINLLVFLVSVVMFNKNILSSQATGYSHYQDYDSFFTRRHYRKIKRSESYDTIMLQAYGYSEKKKKLKRKLIRPFRYAFSLKSYFPQSLAFGRGKKKLSIRDVSIPYNGEFLIWGEDNKKILQKGCPLSICDDNSFVVSLQKIKNERIKIVPKRDTDIYIVRDSNSKDVKCHKFISKKNNIFFYKLQCNNYKIDKGSKAFVVSENT